ncbi:MAG: AAA family ATPase [Deltaproteobacteria bacterium RIFOXYD12_FULL_55_16]|nr:MAG: AAA family ATPase [Deltaproteobacteria bacterium RIFOXYD12_FULL_55_16]
MIKRTLADKLITLAHHFPVLSITGPRQSGKTTLAQAVFKDHQYVSLEDPNEHEAALADPKGFLRRFADGVVLDEVQRAPVLLSCIQGIVDAEKKPGRFVLTGSQQFHLMAKVTQTLAGRTALVNLFPFSLDELLGREPADPWRIALAEPPAHAAPDFSLEEIILKGMYPPVHDRGAEPQDWYASYYRTYIERDVRELVNIGNLDAFQRFVRLCAGRSGQLLNLSSLAQDAGISHTTARNWLSVLEAGFIVQQLSPHFSNFAKRIIKTPKLYFLDTGLLCYLLRIRNPFELMTHSMRGAIFETFVVAEFIKAFSHRGDTPPLYFWRDQGGHEVDLVIDLGERLFPIEIKSGETITPSYFKGLEFFCGLGKPATTNGMLVHGGSTAYQRGPFRICPWYL